MVDLGQKKVDSYPPFFMLCFEIKESLPGFPGKLSFIKTLKTVILLLLHI